MKRLMAGLCCFLAGVLLCAVNWLGAVVSMPLLDSWSGSRLAAAWHLAGYGPLVFGIILFVLGAFLIIWSFAESSDTGDRPG
jgi:hypothetical protein